MPIEQLFECKQIGVVRILQLVAARRRHASRAAVQLVLEAGTDVRGGCSKRLAVALAGQRGRKGSFLSRQEYRILFMKRTHRARGAAVTRHGRSRSGAELVASMKVVCGI